MKAKQLFSKYGPQVIGIFILLGAAFAASALTAPTQAPPGGNVEAPINVGGDTQEKIGGIRAAGFRSFLDSYFDGKVGIGTVTPQNLLHLRGLAATEERFETATQSGSIAFNYTGSSQSWVVPPNVTSIQVDVRGAEGGPGSYAYPPGKGGRTQTTITVMQGETLSIYVGGKGTGSGGGWPGGGNPGASAGGGYVGGGGGASVIYKGGERAVVSGGGGGAGFGVSDSRQSIFNKGSGGGAGGGPDGGDGGAGYYYCGIIPWTITGGGQGGTQSGGGGRGSALQDQRVRNGGGGGGGYYGGGGGGGMEVGTAGDVGVGGDGGLGGDGEFCDISSGGGGGGSSWADPAKTAGTAYTAGYQSGNGSVTISWLAGFDDWTIGGRQEGAVVKFKISNSSSLGTNDKLIIDGTNNVVEIPGQLKVLGGNPGPGKMLTSDSSGLASWGATVGAGVMYLENDHYTSPDPGWCPNGWSQADFRSVRSGDTTVDRRTCYR